MSLKQLAKRAYDRAHALLVEALSIAVGMTESNEPLRTADAVHKIRTDLNKLDATKVDALIVMVVHKVPGGEQGGVLIESIGAEVVYEPLLALFKLEREYVRFCARAENSDTCQCVNCQLRRRMEAGDLSAAEELLEKFLSKSQTEVHGNHTKH